MQQLNYRTELTNKKRSYCSNSYTPVYVKWIISSDSAEKPWRPHGNMKVQSKQNCLDWRVELCLRYMFSVWLAKAFHHSDRREGMRETRESTCEQESTEQHQVRERETSSFSYLNSFFSTVIVLTAFF